MNNIPDDFLRAVFSTFNGKDLVAVSLVCKNWKRVAEADDLWAEIYKKEIDENQQKTDHCTFKEAFRLEKSWAQGKIHTTRLESIYVCGVSIHDKNKVIAGTFRCPVEINVKLGKVTLHQDEDFAMSCVKFKGNLVVGGEARESGVIKLWNRKSHKCVKTIQPQGGGVLCVDFVGDPARLIVGGLADGNIKLWDVRSGDCWGGLNGHKGKVTCIVVVSGVLASGSQDGRVKLWDIDQGECVRTFSDCRYGVVCLAFDGRRVVCGEYSRLIRVWDLGSDRHVRIRAAISHVKLVDRWIVGGSEEGMVAMWDAQTGKCIREIAHPMRANLQSLDFDGRMIACAFDNEVIKLFEIEERTKGVKRGVVKLQRKLRAEDIAMSGVLAAEVVGIGGALLAYGISALTKK